MRSDFLVFLVMLFLSCVYSGKIEKLDCTKVFMQDFPLEFNKNNLIGKWEYVSSVIDDTCFVIDDFSYVMFPKKCEFLYCNDSLDLYNSSSLYDKRKGSLMSGILCKIDISEKNYNTYPIVRIIKKNEKTFLRIVHLSLQEERVPKKLEYSINFISSDTLIFQDNLLYFPKKYKVQAQHLLIKLQ